MALVLSDERNGSGALSCCASQQDHCLPFGKPSRAASLCVSTGQPLPALGTMRSHKPGLDTWLQISLRDLCEAPPRPDLCFWSGCQQVPVVSVPRPVLPRSAQPLLFCEAVFLCFLSRPTCCLLQFCSHEDRLWQATWGLGHEGRAVRVGTRPLHLLELRSLKGRITRAEGESGCGLEAWPT